MSSGKKNQANERIAERLAFHNHQMLFHERMKDISLQNSMLKQRLHKYEQINECIESLVNKNANLEEQLRKQKLKNTQASTSNGFKNFEEYQKQIERLDLLHQKKLLQTQMRAKKFIDEYQQLAMEQIGTLKKNEQKTILLEQKLAEIQAKLSIREKEIEIVLQENSLLKEDAQILNSKLGSEISEKGRIMNDYHKVCDQNKKLSDQNRIFEKNIHQKSMKLKDLQNKNQILTEDAYKIKKQLQKEQVKNKANQQSYQQINQKLKKEKFIHDNLSKEHRESCELKEKLEKKLLVIQNKLSKTEKQLAQNKIEKDNEISLLTKLIEDYQTENKQTKRSLEMKKHECKRLDQLLNGAHLEYEGIIQNKILLEEQVLKVKEFLNELKQQNLQLRRKCSDYEQIVLNQRQKVEKADICIDKMRSLHRKLSEEFSDFKKIANQKQSQLIAEYQKRISSLVENFNQEKSILTENHQMDRQKIKASFEYELSIHERYAKQKLNILEKDIDLYRKNLEQSKREEYFQKSTGFI